MKRGYTSHKALLRVLLLAGYGLWENVSMIEVNEIVDRYILRVRPNAYSQWEKAHKRVA
jgi:hypothetical protein